jgi:hypothetical protein
MTHIICRAMICLFWEQGVCISEEIEYEPDVGCLTFQDISDLELEEEEEAADWGEEPPRADDEEEEEDWDDDDWDDEELDL